MIDFEALINSALADGYDKEDLAAMFTDALNTTKEETDDWESWFRNMYASTDNEVEEAYVSLVEAIANEHKDWTTEDLQDVYNNIENNVETIIKVTEGFKDGKSPVSMLVENIKDTCSKFDVEKIIGEFLENLS